MSQHAPTDLLPLFAPTTPPAASVPAQRGVLERQQADHAAFLARLRMIIGSRFGGTDARVTTDHVWQAMADENISLPPGASPNILGGFFSTWSRAVPVLDSEGKQRKTPSRRKGANGNPLSVWTIK